MADEEVDWGMDEDVWRQGDGVPAGGANEDEISLDGMEAESEGMSSSNTYILMQSLMNQYQSLLAQRQLLHLKQQLLQRAYRLPDPVDHLVEEMSLNLLDCQRVQNGIIPETEIRIIIREWDQVLLLVVLMV